VLLSSPELPGSIWHDCVPEPLSASVLALAGLMAISSRRH
jgi:hypothetical protein